MPAMCCYCSVVFHKSEELQKEKALLVCSQSVGCPQNLRRCPLPWKLSISSRVKQLSLGRSVCEKSSFWFSYHQDVSKSSTNICPCYFTLQMSHLPARSCFGSEGFSTAFFVCGVLTLLLKEDSLTETQALIAPSTSSDMGTAGLTTLPS